MKTVLEVVTPLTGQNIRIHNDDKIITRKNTA